MILPKKLSLGVKQQSLNKSIIATREVIQTNLSNFIMT
jgi:hypothetical protein